MGWRSCLFLPLGCIFNKIEDMTTNGRIWRSCTVRRLTNPYVIRAHGYQFCSSNSRIGGNAIDKDTKIFRLMGLVKRGRLDLQLRCQSSVRCIELIKLAAVRPQELNVR